MSEEKIPWEEFKRQWSLEGMSKDKQRLAEAAWQAALKFVNTNSESEAGAFGTVVTFDDGSNVFRNKGEPFPPTAKGYIATEVYAAPPAAQVIETAAYIRAAEAVRNVYAKSTQSPDESGTLMDAALAVEALIPQDGRTQLEEFGMKCISEGLQKVDGDILYNVTFPDDDERCAIVTNLIGDPPLNSETVSGEKK